VLLNAENQRQSTRKMLLERPMSRKKNAKNPKPSTLPEQGVLAPAARSVRGETHQSQGEWESEQKENLARLLAPRPVKKVALMGISGWPPHIGHALAAQKLAESYDLVLVSPADGNPFKPHLPPLQSRLRQTENLMREALPKHGRVKVRSIGGLVAQAKRAQGEENPQAFTIEELAWIKREGEILGEIWEAKAAFGPDVLQAGSFERFKDAGRILAEFGVEKMPDNGCPRSSQLRAAMASVNRWGASEFLALAGRVGRANALEYLSTGEFLKIGHSIDEEAIFEALGKCSFNHSSTPDSALFASASPSSNGPSEPAPSRVSPRLPAQVFSRKRTMGP